MLRSITYVSEMTSTMSDEEIRDLALRSCSRNKAVSITGLLFHLGDKFVQVLEGPPVAVGALYKKIQLDARHRHLKLVLDVPIDARVYDGGAALVMSGDSLTDAERGIIFHALQAFEPHTVLGPKVKSAAGALAEAMDMIMARALPIDMTMVEAESVSELLYVGELLLLRENTIDEAALAKVAESANISLRVTQNYFPTIDDLIRTCILRVLALEHQKFLSIIVSERFLRRRDLAQAITDFVIATNSRSNVSPIIAEHFAIHGGGFTSETAWIIAGALFAEDSGERLPFQGLTIARLAMSIDAGDAAARILARHDAPALVDPQMRDLIFDICLAALEGGKSAGESTHLVSPI